jgi:hypothetical protein
MLRSHRYLLIAITTRQLINKNAPLYEGLKIRREKEG